MRGGEENERFSEENATFDRKYSIMLFQRCIDGKGGGSLKRMVANEITILSPYMIRGKM